MKDIESLRIELNGLKEVLEGHPKNRILDTCILCAIQNTDTFITSPKIAFLINEPTKKVTKRLTMIMKSTVIDNYVIRSEKMTNFKYGYLPTSLLKKENILKSSTLIHNNIDKSKRLSTKETTMKKNGQRLKYKLLGQNVVWAILDSGKNGITTEEISKKLNLPYKSISGELGRWDKSLMKVLFKYDKGDVKGRKKDKYYPPSVIDIANIGKDTFYYDHKHEVDLGESVKLINKKVEDGSLEVLYGCFKDKKMVVKIGELNG